MSTVVSAEQCDFTATGRVRHAFQEATGTASLVEQVQGLLYQDLVSCTNTHTGGGSSILEIHKGSCLLWTEVSQLKHPLLVDIKDIPQLLAPGHTSEGSVMVDKACH